MNYYNYGKNSYLIQMDCMEYLPQLDDCSVDFVLTDPPYNIDLNYNKYDDNLDEDDFWGWIELIYSQIYRVLKDKRHLIFTCAQKQIWKYRSLLEDIGFEFRHLGIWCNPTRKAGSFPGQWPYAWEAVLDFTKNGFRKLNNSNSVGYMDIWIEEAPTVDHPASRPIDCWRELVGLATNPNELVFDPFAGSGTTNVVCKQIDRNCVGIELDEDYFQQSVNRVETVDQMNVDELNRYKEQDYVDF